MKMLRNTVLGLVLATSIPMAVVPVEARDHYRYYSHRHDNGAAIAVSAGSVGLAIGAAIASDRSQYYYGDNYYYREHYYRPHYRSYNYYYDSYPHYYDGRRYRHHERRWHHEDDDDQD